MLIKPTSLVLKEHFFCILSVLTRLVGPSQFSPQAACKGGLADTNYFIIILLLLFIVVIIIIINERLLSTRQA